MDSYQAIYDATRSKIGSFNGERLIDEILQQFDFSHYATMIKDDMLNSSYEMQRPSVLFKPVLSVDGNQWCALLGADLQSGIAGFGDSPDLAMRDFDKSWGVKIQDWPINKNK